MAEPTAPKVADYALQLRQLLPRGLAWAIREGTTYADFVDGLATEFARTESRFDELILEMDPHTTTELLVEWERNFGLPGECGTLASTVIVRRSAVAARLASQGGQSPAYFVTVAAAIGWAVEIEEYCAPAPGSPCAFGAGRGLSGAGWPHTFTVHAPPMAFQVFEASQSAAGDPLTTLDLSALLECTIGALKPAHSVVTFEYDLPQAHTWGPWAEIALPPIGLQLVPVAPVVTNPY